MYIGWSYDRAAQRAFGKGPIISVIAELGADGLPFELTLRKRKKFLKPAFTGTITIWSKSEIQYKNIVYPCLKWIAKELNWSSNIWKSVFSGKDNVLRTLKAEGYWSAKGGWYMGEEEEEEEEEEEDSS